MKKLEAVKYFGGSLKLADALSITSGAVSQWGEVIPERQAFRLDRMTGGKLKYRPELYQTTPIAQTEAVA